LPTGPTNCSRRARRTIGVFDGPDGLVVPTAGLIVPQELERHDPDAGGHADDPRAIEPGRDRAGHVGAVVVVVDVVDALVVVAEVPAVDVVDVPVAVIVDPVGLLAPAGFAGVHPRLTGKIRLTEIDAIVDDRHDHPGPGLDGERLAPVDVDIGSAAHLLDRLAGVVEAPQERPQLLVPGVEIAIQPVADVDRSHGRVAFQPALLGSERSTFDRVHRLTRATIEVDELQAGMLGVASVRARRSRRVGDDQACGVVPALFPRTTAVDGAARAVSRRDAAGRGKEHEPRQDEQDPDAGRGAASARHVRDPSDAGRTSDGCTRASYAPVESLVTT
jgi:hypothetical protein